MTKTDNLPTYDQLPINPKYSDKVAWGVWGDDDSLGTLNNITDEITLNASKLVKKGKVYPLNWKLESPSPAMFQRPSVKHNLHAFPGGVGFDDSYDNFNPQSSSQWDGLGHICHLGCGGRFYNNVKHEDILEGRDEQIGIHHMARRGIATRAVLLDYARWAEKNKPDFDPFVRYEISVDELKQVANDQKVTFQKGDILLVRIGWMAKYEHLGDKAAETIGDLTSPVNAGVKACPETYEWIWNNHFAAVGGMYHHLYIYIYLFFL
ncbi:unnamed protein product [Cunninghamella blakesleeana]